MSVEAALTISQPSRQKSWVASVVSKRALSWIRLALILLAFVGAIAYNNYGSPGSWFSDELTWVTAGMITNRDFNPHFFAYPAGLQIYSSFFIYKFLHIFSRQPNIVNMYLLNGIARTLSALFFVSGVILFERGVARLKGQPQDLFTLIVFATSCAMIHHAHIGTAQASLFLAIAFVNYTTSLCLIKRSSQAYYATVFACGIAIGTKYTGIYLSVCLPFLFFSCLNSLSLKFLAFRIVATIIVGFIGVVIFNPFIVIDHQAFLNDVLMVAVKEAPMFVSQTSGAAYHASMAYYYLSAFFGPLARIAVLAFGMTAVVVSVGVLLMTDRREGNNRRGDLRNMALFIVIGTFALLAYFELEVAVNISQSRYYIPIGLTLAAIMCVGRNLMIGALLSSGRTWVTMIFVRLIQTSGWLVAASCSALGLAYILVFPLSGHIEAFDVMAATLKTDPTERLSQLSLHSRAAVSFDKRTCTGRCTTILNGYKGSDIDVSDMSSWNEYFDQLKKRLNQSNPDLVAIENIFFYWTFMIPKGDHDYSDRFKLQNPGPKAFEAALSEAGYTLKKMVPRIDPRLKTYDPVLNDAFDNAAEGVGGDVYLFQKAPPLR